MVGEEPSSPDGLALRKPMVSASHYLSISHLSVANPEQVFFTIGHQQKASLPAILNFCI
jgi:hypothetical protein